MKVVYSNQPDYGSEFSKEQKRCPVCGTVSNQVAVERILDGTAYRHWIGGDSSGVREVSKTILGHTCCNASKPWHMQKRMEMDIKAGHGFCDF